MRVSTVRLWITAGFGLLVVELAGLVYVLIRTSGELASLQKTVQELKQKNDKLELQIRTLNNQIGKVRRGGPEEPEETTPKTGGTETAKTLTAAEWVLEYREPSDKAAEELRRLGPRGVAAVADAFRRETDPDIRASYAQLLGTFKDREALNQLETLLGEATGKPLRVAILRAILRHPGAPELPLLQPQLVAERDIEVLVELVGVIRKIDSDAAVTALAQKYETVAEADRASYLQNLVGVRRASIRPFYERVLGESQLVSLRVACVRGLADCGDSSTIQLLERLKSNDQESEEVRKAADAALAKLRG